MHISNLFYFLLSKFSRKKVFWKGFAVANGFGSKDRFNLYRRFFSKNNNSSENGYNPPTNDVFFKEGYLVEYPDIEESGVDPWIHYVTKGKQEGRDNGLHPTNDVFFKEGYLIEYPDIEESGVDPWIHYATNGKQECRDNGLHPSNDVFDSFKYYLMFLSCNILPSVSWEDYVFSYSRKHHYDLNILVIKNSIFFNEDWYRWNYSDVDFSTVTPAEHYLYKGWKQEKNPSLDFSTTEYLAHYPDLKTSNICPLLHYEKFGRLEGRSYWADTNRARNQVAQALKQEKSVLLISHELSFTGAPLSLIFAAKILKNSGYSVAVVSLCEGKLSSEYEKFGIPCYVTRSKCIIELLSSLSSIVIVNTLVCYEYYELSAKVAPTIWWIRESPNLLFNLGYCSSVLRDAKNVYVMSDYSKAQFLEYNNSIKVIKHGLLDCYVKEQDIQQNKKNDSKIMFSFLGSYNSRKGIDILLLAINQLPDDVLKNCVFFFAGNIHDNEDYMNELRNLIVDRCKDSIIFHDSITDKNKLEEVFYQSACFIVPSREEPTSRVVIEAMMHGRPCIISDKVGAAYLVNDATGLIFSNESYQELSLCIQKIYDKLVSERDYYFESTRKAYFDNNSVEKYTHNLIDSINDAISGN